MSGLLRQLLTGMLSWRHTLAIRTIRDLRYLQVDVGQAVEIENRQPRVYFAIAGWHGQIFLK